MRTRPRRSSSAPSEGCSPPPVWSKRPPPWRRSSPWSSSPHSVSAALRCAGVPFGQVPRDLGRCLRLLAVGLPLPVVAGWALANWFLPGLGTGWPCWWLLRSRRPTRRRGCPSSPTPPCRRASARLRTVESGLNDASSRPLPASRTMPRAHSRGLRNPSHPRRVTLQPLRRGALASWCRTVSPAGRGSDVQVDGLLG